MKYFLSLAFPLLFLSGCGDDAMVQIFDKKFTKSKVECMRLVVFPSDQEIEKTLHLLYDFDVKCSVILEVSKKAGITCNSNQNIQKKALTNFPSSYLKMQVKEGRELKYSYYIDLEKAVTPTDVQKGFQRIQTDLDL